MGIEYYPYHGCGVGSENLEMVSNQWTMPEEKNPYTSEKWDKVPDTEWNNTLEKWYRVPNANQTDIRDTQVSVKYIYQVTNFRGQYEFLVDPTH